MTATSGGCGGGSHRRYLRFLDATCPNSPARSVSPPTSASARRAVNVLVSYISSMETLTGLVTAVDHVGIAVPDLDEAIAWYADTFGLVATHIETNEEQGVREA